MKKLFCIFVAALIIATSSVSAIAVTNDGSVSSNPTNIVVNGTYVSAEDADKIVSVDISWGAMSFTYTEGSNGSWNSDKHQYDSVGESTWTAQGNDITITNHSNMEIKAVLDFTASIDGIVGKFTESSGTVNDDVIELATAEGTSTASAPNATATFNIIEGSLSSSGEIGNITVTITQNVSSSNDSSASNSSEESNASDSETDDTNSPSASDPVITGLTINTDSANYDEASCDFYLISNGDPLIINLSGENLTWLDETNTTYGVYVGGVFFPVYESSQTDYSCVINDDYSATFTFTSGYNYNTSDDICYSNAGNVFSSFIHTEYYLWLEEDLG